MRLCQKRDLKFNNEKNNDILKRPRFFSNELEKCESKMLIITTVDNYQAL